MLIELILPGHPPAPCVRYQMHVHTEVTRDRRAPDPRVAGRSRHEDLLISREPDGLSPQLLYCCAAGQRIDEVQVVLRTGPATPAAVSPIAPHGEPQELVGLDLHPAPPPPAPSTPGDPPPPDVEATTSSPPPAASPGGEAVAGPDPPEAPPPVPGETSAPGTPTTQVPPPVFGEVRLTITLRDVFVVSVLSSLEDGHALETVALSYGWIGWSAPESLGGASTAWTVYGARQEAGVIHHPVTTERGPE